MFITINSFVPFSTQANFELLILLSEYQLRLSVSWTILTILYFVNYLQQHFKGSHILFYHFVSDSRQNRRIYIKNWNSQVRSCGHERIKPFSFVLRRLRSCTLKFTIRLHESFSGHFKICFKSTE